MEGEAEEGAKRGKEGGWAGGTNHERDGRAVDPNTR